MNKQKTKIDIVDAKNLPCPLPLLKTKKALNLMKTGKKIMILTTDLNSKQDIHSLCKKLGHPIEILDKKNHFEIYIEKVN